MRKFHLLLVAGILLCSCSPKVTTSVVASRQPLEYDSHLYLLGIKDPPPKDAVLVGSVSVGDTGFSTDCDFDVVLARVQEEARKVGANIVHITNHKFPNVFTSTCHRIKANLLYAPNPVLEDLGVQVDDNYAVLYIYRPGWHGSAVSYDLYLDDSFVTRVYSNWGRVVKPIKGGNYTIWAKTESRIAEPITIENGKVYYIRCGVSGGVVIGRPTIEVVSPDKGRIELMSIKKLE